jgi:hypothetical protein
MFSSWLFPVLLKAVLAQGRAYELTAEDSDCLEVAEDFITADISRWDEAQQTLGWSEVEERISWRALDRALQNRGSS